MFILDWGFRNLNFIFLIYNIYLRYYVILADYKFNKKVGI